MRELPKSRTTALAILLVTAWVPTIRCPAEDAYPSIARVLPPLGIKVTEADHERLAAGVEKLRRRLDEFAKRQASEESSSDDLADVGIFLKAVDFALKHGEFYQPRDIELAADLLKTGQARLDDLEAGRRPWSEARGLVVRGYKSELDDSYQPYGLVIPEKLDLKKPIPLYVWLHGRGDKVTDLQFIAQRQKSKGQIAPDDAIVLHPFGRYCNAFKFAGEEDVLDAIDAVKRNYKIDPDRVALWGFSMGGAGAWHLAAHYPDRWVAVSPGAGFAETRRYQNLQPKDYPPAYEQTLWHLYDVPSYTRNLFNLPVIAYSGEKDKQIQAARVMEEAFKEHGRTLQHIIGPGMGHAYHPKSLEEISRVMREHVQRGRDRWPKKVSIQTRTTRYHRCYWALIFAVDQHWEETRLDAEIIDDKSIRVTTRNVMSFILWVPWPKVETFTGKELVEIDGKPLGVPSGHSRVLFVKTKGGWEFNTAGVTIFGTHKSARMPGPGPIDDAFTRSFLVVPPNGECAHPAVDKWVRHELDHFLTRWRLLFRGEPRVKQVKELTRDDYEQYNLILWGDPTGNSLIERVLSLEQGARKLPVTWDKTHCSLGENETDASRHVLTMIRPNLLGPSRYVVLNSGPTFREGHDRTNSQQTPKLPDWAIIDIRTPPDAYKPGKVAAAGFFDESWNLPSAAKNK
jgi:dienelactone hydrolase